MNEILILVSVPVIWYFISISYQLIKLFKLWISYKLQNIKETQLWD